MVRSIRFRNTRTVRTTSLLSKLARTSVILAFRDSFLLWGCLPVFTSRSQTTQKKSHGLRGWPGDLRSELFQVLRRPSLGLVGIVGQCSILLEHTMMLSSNAFNSWLDHWVYCLNVGIYARTLTLSSSAKKNVGMTSFLLEITPALQQWQEISWT